MDESGLSTIVATGNVSLGEKWQVFDDGAPLGKWGVVTAGESLSPPATVVLPGADWSWGVDNGKTLWVRHVPEPSSLMLLAIGAVALLAYAWQRRSHR